MKKIMEDFLNINENLNGNVVTFDFDGTIFKSFLNKRDGDVEEMHYGGVNKQIIKRIKHFKRSGKTVFVVSERSSHQEEGDWSIKSILLNLEIDVDGVFFTNGESKAKKLYELGSKLHFDDDEKEFEDIEAYKKLHKSFEIVVKNAEDLVKDTNDISKGLIVTTDGKFIVAQRSDSYEWDAPGGHIQEGETPEYAFWREIKEELDIEVEEIIRLGTKQVVWMGVEKTCHHFLGVIPYPSTEIKGILNLQWEVADFFCGDIKEIMQKCRGNMTQNLQNSIQLAQNEDTLYENFQQKMKKGHSKMKKRLIGFGNSRTTGASGLKRVSDFSRSKSAPPGFGVLEEENEEIKQNTIKIKIKGEK